MAVRATYRIEAKLSDTVDQFFDEWELTDFDAVTPAWDKEVDRRAEFTDGIVDGDTDMNDHADAAHDGAVGLEFTFDDNNIMYGVMNADAADQTSGVLSFWLNTNDVAVDDTKVIRLVYFRDGAGAINWQVRLYNDGGTYQIGIFAEDDLGGGGLVGAYQDLAAGWNNIKIMFDRSTGIGNNDGFMRLYIDDVLVEEDTTLDNDTLDWDYIRIGMLLTNSAGFGGSFYLDTIKLDPVGAPMVDTLAMQNGTYGLAIPVMDTTARYGSFTNPDAETVAMAECWIDPNVVTMAADDEIVLIKADAADFYVTLKYSGGYKIYATAALDVGSESTSEYLITDAPHHIRIYWAASTADGNDDGYLHLYIDHVLQESLTGLNNDTVDIANIYFGVTTALDAGTYGIFYMDDCRWGPWIDITDDVTKDIKGYWGMSDNGPLDLLAKTGVMSIVLNNDDGKYLPGQSTALDGFKKGTPVRLRFSYSDLDYIRFYGTIDDINPLPGAFVSKRVTVEVTDWMDYAATHPMVNPAIGTDQTADQMLTTVVADMPIAPLATDYDTGVNTFPTAFDNVTTKTKAYTEISKVMFSELGYCYLIKDPVYGETLVFDNAEARNGLRTPDFTSDNTMTSLEVEYGKNVINRFINKVYPRLVTAAPVVLFDSEVRQKVPSGHTVIFRGNYTDPDGGGTEISGINVLDPVINVDYDATGNRDGTGSDFTADITVGVDKGTEGTTFTLTSAAPSTAWVWIRIKGDGVKAYNPIEHSAEDATSIAEFDYQSIILYQKYMDDLHRGSLIGASVIEQEKQPRTKLNKVNFVANRTDALMLAWLKWDVGDMCYIKEDDWEIDEYAYIQGVELTISPGGLIKFSWIVKGMQSLLKGLDLISCEFDDATLDAVDFGYLPQASNLTLRSISARIYLHADPALRGHVVGALGELSSAFPPGEWGTGYWFAVGTGRKAEFIQVHTGAGSADGIWQSALNSIPLNAWTDLIITHNLTVSTTAPIIYIDGVNQAPLTEVQAPLGNVADEEGNHLVIGNNISATQHTKSMDGLIKDVCVYDVILTQAEATSHAAGGDITRGLVFQGPCVRTADLDYFEDLTLDPLVDRLIDNMYGMIGTPANTVITRLIP